MLNDSPADLVAIAIGFGLKRHNPSTLKEDSVPNRKILKVVGKVYIPLMLTSIVYDLWQIEHNKHSPTLEENSILYGTINMYIADGLFEDNLLRVIPKPIQDATMICLPQFIGKSFEQGIIQSVPTAVHYCENTMVIADNRRMQNGTTFLYNLEYVEIGDVFGSNKLLNYFLIYAGNTKIFGGNNTVNTFFFIKKENFLVTPYNATNIIDLS